MTTTQPTRANAIAFSGEIDVETAPAFREAIDAAFAADGSVNLDLGDVTFIDSSGLCVLIGAYKTAQNLSLPFRVTRASRQLRRVLDVTGQTERFLGSDSG